MTERATRERTSQRPSAGAAPARPPRAGERTAGSGTAFRFQLTTRGALLGLLALYLAAFLVAARLHADAVAGACFCAGSVLASCYLRRQSQLQVTVSVPAIALLAVIISQALTAQGNSSHGSAMSVVEGTLLTLAALAPWLLAGTAACLAIACFRGLPQCVRDLRAGLRAEPEAAQHTSGRPGSYAGPAL